MIQGLADASQNYVVQFGLLHRQNPRLAYTNLISMFVTCYAMLTAKERPKVIAPLLELIKDIGDSAFEDGQDFYTFMIEKLDEKENG